MPAPDLMKFPKFPPPSAMPPARIVRPAVPVAVSVRVTPLVDALKVPLDSCSALLITKFTPWLSSVLSPSITTVLASATGCSRFSKPNPLFGRRVPPLRMMLPLLSAALLARLTVMPVLIELVPLKLLAVFTLTVPPPLVIAMLAAATLLLIAPNCTLLAPVSVALFNERMPVPPPRR